MDGEIVTLLVGLFAMVPGVYAAAMQRKTAKDTQVVSHSAAVIRGFDDLCKSQRECIEQQEERIKRRDQELAQLVIRLSEVESELQTLKIQLAQLKQENSDLRAKILKLEIERDELLAKLQKYAENEENDGDVG